MYIHTYIYGPGAPNRQKLLPGEGRKANPFFWFVEQKGKGENSCGKREDKLNMKPSGNGEVQ